MPGASRDRRRRDAGLVGILVGTLLWAGAGQAVAGAEASVDGLSGRFGDRIQELMDEYAVPGVAVALIKEGELVWSEAYGYADVEAGRPMTTDTPNRAESISKSVTAWGVMTLVEDGRLGLDDPVANYVKEFSIPASVTVGQLLSHTSGISAGTIGREYAPEGRVPSLREGLAGEIEFVGPSGQAFLYSNTGFNLLELVVEEVTGEDFAAYMQREVLDPLSMESSSFAWSSDFAPPVPPGHDLQGEPVPVYVYPEKASGGLFASVEDVARFVAAGVAHETPVLDASRVRQLYEPEAEITGLFRLVSPSYGLGTSSRPCPTGRRRFGTAGRAMGG